MTLFILVVYYSTNIIALSIVDISIIKFSSINTAIQPAFQTTRSSVKKKTRENLSNPTTFAKKRIS
jgi:hypothetical protein